MRDGPSIRVVGCNSAQWEELRAERRLFAGRLPPEALVLRLRIKATVHLASLLHRRRRLRLEHLTLRDATFCRLLLNLNMSHSSPIWALIFSFFNPACAEPFRRDDAYRQASGQFSNST